MNRRGVSREVRALSELAIGVLGLDGRWVRVDRKLANAVGRSTAWLLANPATAAVHPQDRAEVDGALALVLRGVVTDRRWEVRWITEDGQVRRGSVTVALLRSADGSPTQAVVVLENLEQRHRVITDLVDAAARDELTALHNRAGAHSSIQAWLDEGRRVGLVFCDLDRFKVVNDALGHQVGDQLLVAVGGRLHAAAPEGSVVARMGGDEFLVAVPDCPDDETLLGVANRACDALADPVSCAGHLLTVAMSAGAVLAAPGVDLTVAVRNADVAMYAAKRSRTGRAVLYAEPMGAAVQRRLQVETALRGALAQRLVTPVYQPVVHLHSGRWGGVEVLARWTDDTLGPVDPAEFVAVAEDVGLVRELTQQIAERAFTDLAGWHTAGLAHDLRIGLNISAGDLTDATLISWLAALAEQHHVSPAMLVLEVTETTLLRAGQDAVAVLEDLADLGATVSLDDFGTGHSRLSHLRELPVREIKIDRSVISGAPHATGLTDPQLVHALVALGDRLDLRVLAEGIETREQHEQASAAGCLLGQGYYYGRPMTSTALAACLLRNGPGLPRSTRDNPRSS